jgi:hypothetical protein
VAEAAFDAGSGHRAMAGLLARRQIDAAFVASDVVAFGAIAAIREAGLRVPDDVSVVGFDDIALAAFFDRRSRPSACPHTTWASPRSNCSTDRRPTCRTGRSPTELIVRSSTRPPSSPMHRGPVPDQHFRRWGRRMGRGRSAVQGKETRMQQSTRAWRRVAAVMGAAALVFAACSSNSSGSTKAVNVIGTWGGDGWAMPDQPATLFNWSNLPACPLATATRDISDQPYLLRLAVADATGATAGLPVGPDEAVRRGRRAPPLDDVPTWPSTRRDRSALVNSAPSAARPSACSSRLRSRA